MTAATLDGWMAARMGLAVPLTRAAIEAWQVACLADAVAYAREKSPFYRARDDWPDHATASLDELRCLPFTTPAQLARSDPPFLAVSQGAVERVVTLTSSGTSGLAKRVHFSPADREATLDFFHHGMGLFTRPEDRVAIAFPGGHAGGIADGLAAALRRLGARAELAPHPLDPPALAAWLRQQAPDIVAGPPVPLLAASRFAACDGGPPLRARALLLSSDHVADSLARSLAAAFSAEVFCHWGMTETGYGGAVDCACHCGCHLRENELYIEIVKPGTGAQLPAGMLGEIVVTTLRRRATPLVRYRTGDLARLIDDPCPCGSVLRRLDGFSGRLDETILLPGGGDLTMPRLDEAVFDVDAVADFAAVFIADAPARLELAVVAPPPWQVQATLDAVRARLGADPAIGAAMRERRLTVEVAFADAPIRRQGKRRIITENATRWARCC